MRAGRRLRARLQMPDALVETLLHSRDGRPCRWWRVRAGDARAKAEAQRRKEGVDGSSRSEGFLTRALQNGLFCCLIWVLARGSRVRNGYRFGVRRRRPWSPLPASVRESQLTRAATSFTQRRHRRRSRSDGGLGDAPSFGAEERVAQRIAYIRHPTVVGRLFTKRTPGSARVGGCQGSSRRTSPPPTERPWLVT
jgi:hypothetical protein